MASEDMPIVEQVLHMNGGVGETSYASNSSPQKKVMMRARPVLEDIIIKIMYGTNLPTCIKVADLGCSSGPNALLLASNVIQIVHETSIGLKVETPTFQIFLNDLFGNDFNSIFKTLPEFHNTLKQDTTCFINATPGTFYGSLFPSNSIHFFHSSFSLHWLSQVPNLLREEAKIRDDDNDKGNIYLASIYPPSHAKQFKEDFKKFLKSRSKELVPGGGMLLTFIGRYDGSQVITAPGFFRVVLNDMVLENLIEKAKVESFNLPFYTAREEEVREIIKEEGSFRVEKFESLKTSWNGSSSFDDEEGNGSFRDDADRAEYLTKGVRAIFEPLLKAHFGEEIMDELFVRVKNKVIQFLPKLMYPTMVISLTKIV